MPIKASLVSICRSNMTLRPVFAVAVLILFVFGTTEARKLPPYITKCKSDNSNAEQCITEAAEAIRPKLGKGIPALGIPPCDPLVIPQLDLVQPETSTLGFNAHLKNVEFYGGPSFQILKSNMDLQKGIVELTLKLPFANITGDYKAKGKILVVQFEGEGKINCDFSDIVYTGTWICEKVVRKGKEYYKVKDHKSSMDVGDLSAYFENIFNGNKELSDNVNVMINENKEVLVNEVKPIVVEALSGIISNVVNYVLSQYTYNELFD